MAVRKIRCDSSASSIVFTRALRVGPIDHRDLDLDAP
jgi:hypothetical protein